MVFKFKKAVSVLLSFLIVLQAAGITVFAHDEPESDNALQKSYTALINDVLGTSEMPHKGGIWVNEDSKDAVLSVLNGISSQIYSVDADGFIMQQIRNKSTVNEYDKKLKKLMNGSKTILVSVSDVYMAYNDTVGEEYSVMLEDSDYALLFEKSSRLNIAMLNISHYAWQQADCDSPQLLADEFLSLFFRDIKDNPAAEQGAQNTEKPFGYYAGASLPSVGLYRNFTSGTYGKSGLGRELKWYKIGKGPNKVFAVFAQHGWEDAWSSDGAELVKIADRVMKSLSSGSQDIFKDWTVYIIPYANPDGITDGYTNNGPGRCTVTTKVDMNRCWPSNFNPSYSDRNYTGKNPLGAPEAAQLKSFLSGNMGKYTNVVLDVHGWLNQTIGNPEVGQYFVNTFKGNGFYHKNSHGKGYLETWAYNQGAQSCLVEFPMPKNASSIINNNYSGKFTDALMDLMYDFTDKKPVTLAKVSGRPQASKVTGISANVKWNPVSMADGYQVDIMSSSDGRWKSGTTLTAEYNFRNLEFGQTYSVNVRPFRYGSRGIEYGEGWSDICSFKTLDKASAAKQLGAPDTLKAVGTTDSSVKISFTPVSGANMYRLQYSEDNVNWETAAELKNTEYTLANLQADTPYYVRVKAYAVSSKDIAESEKYSAVYRFFTMPKQVDASLLRFNDLNNYAVYSAYVAYTSVYNSFISGTNPPYYTEFSPTKPITRAMLIAILYRMAGNPYEESNPHTENPFTDIQPGVYYYNAACWALDEGITNQTTFKPNDNVTREQTARFLFAYAQAKDMLGNEEYQKVSLQGYSDYNRVHEWAKEPLQWANYNGMITGTQQGYINPQGETQRIHATRILYGFGKVCNIGNFN